MPRTDEASYSALMKEMREKECEDTLLYSRSTKKIEHMSSAESIFYEGSYYRDENDECQCLVRTNFSITKYELLKCISHQNILNLISFDSKTNNVLTEKIDAETFENYANMNREELVDISGNMTPKFKDFIKLVLEVLSFLHNNNIAHGNLLASNILVWQNEERELQLKLFDISGPSYNRVVGPSYNRVVKETKLKYLHNDLIALAKMIQDFAKVDLDSPIDRFCKYISLVNLTIVHALRHPAVAIITNSEKRVFLEQIMEQPNCSSKLRGVQFNWKKDHETMIREEKSAEKTGNRYGDDLWSLVCLVRNTIKHHTDLEASKIASELPRGKFAFLEYVESQYPNFMIDLYEAVGSFV